MTTFDDDSLYEEDLNNTENENDGGEDVDETSSGNEEMRKVFKIDQKMLLFALHSNDYMRTTKIKIQRDKDYLNSM